MTGTNVPRKALAMLAFLLILGMVFLAATSPEQFMAERQKTRAELKNVTWEKLDKKGTYQAAIYKDEVDKYKFQVSPADRARLKTHLKSYFTCNDEAILDKMLDRLPNGYLIISNNLLHDGLSIKGIFLSSKAKYWEWLKDVNALERMMHYYNASVGFYPPTPDSMSALVITEGEVFGIKKLVYVPIIADIDNGQKRVSYKMPTQEAMISYIEKMPAIKPGRTRPEEKFIDACRLHPYFQQKVSNGYKITDQDILKIYEMVVTNMNKKCEVKSISGLYEVHDDYPYLVMEVEMNMSVKLEAFLPGSLSLGSSTEDLVNKITGALVVKYTPLIMKNFRDYTQEWTRTGGPQ